MPGTVGTPQNGHGASNTAVTALIIGCVAPLVTIAAAKAGLTDWIWVIQPIVIALTAIIVRALGNGRVRKD